MKSVKSVVVTSGTLVIVRLLRVKALSSTSHTSLWVHGVGVQLQSQIPPQPPPPLLHSSLPAPLLPLSPTSRHYLPQAARNESNTSQIGAGRGNQFSELLVCPETDLREWSSVTARATASPPLLW